MKNTNLEDMTKAERGEIWIKGILAKEPNYDVDKLYEYWAQCENTVETYEQEAVKTKSIEEMLAESDASGTITFNNPNDIWNYIDERRKNKHNATKKTI